MAEMILFALLLVAWCTLHSGLIAPSVTAFILRTLGDRAGWFRLIYNIISFVTLIPLCLYERSIASQAMFQWEGAYSYVRLVMIAVAGFLFVAGQWNYSFLCFLGIRQVLNPADPQAAEPFQVSGIHRWIRHPWYSAVFLLLWARDWTPVTLLTAIVLSAYVVIGTILEERKMVALFGQPYRDYQRQVPMYFPWKVPHKHSDECA